MSSPPRPHPSRVIKRMRVGLKASKKKEEEKIEAKGIKIVTKEGVQIPMGYPGGYPAPPQGYPANYPPPLPREEPLPEKKKKNDGIKITTDSSVNVKPLTVNDDRENMKAVNVKYPLIPLEPKKGEQIFSYANILWHGNELRYFVVEPQITDQERILIDRIKLDLEERLDIDLNKLGDIKAKQVLKQEIIKSFSIAPRLSPEKKQSLMYYIERDLLGYGKIESLMMDENIEDISCDGIGIPLYIFHRDSRFASLKTNISFSSQDEINSFVGMLSQKCNKSISVAEPLLDGSLPDGSRVQATLGTDIARKGSNFTIRKFTEKPLTPTHMLKFKTLNSTELAYLWLVIENGKTVLVSGGTATGKTSLLNALSLFIRPTMKVVSIEDTAELRLPLPHWIPHVARTPLSIKGNMGEVTLFDLLKTSLRQRPDYIIVGEVRGKEAFVLFQQIATGHAAMATIHAASIPQLIDRLVTPPISLPPTLLENIDVIVFLALSRLGGNYVRRTDSILEVTGIKDNKPDSIKVFEWMPVSDTFETRENSLVLKSISRRLGITEDTIQAEIFRRKKILEWLLEKQVYDYKEVARVISTYYSDPEHVMDLVDST